MKIVFQHGLIIASSFILAEAAISQVSGISSENLVQYGKEQAYWVSNVSCADNSTRIVQRKTDGEQWCGKAIDGFCDVNKEAAAEKICSTGYTSALAALEASVRAQNSAAQAEARARRAEQEREQQRQLANQRIEQQRRAREQQAAVNAPLEKQINIEEELIKIEQEKLDLRRQELELQRRATEIQTLLDGKS